MREKFREIRTRLGIGIGIIGLAGLGSCIWHQYVDDRQVRNGDSIVGHGYAIYPSRLHSDSVIVVATSAGFPRQTVSDSIKRAAALLNKDCQGVIDMEAPGGNEGLRTAIFLVGDRRMEACFPDS